MQQAGKPANDAPPKPQREVPKASEAAATDEKSAFIETVTKWVGKPDCIAECKQILTILEIETDGSAKPEAFAFAQEWVTKQQAKNLSYDKIIDMEEESAIREEAGEAKENEEDVSW